ncbi:unnamed protein product [Closterium sp. Naga37s-1]|nr:unnamed protein product [Closterium sp. Naga37s-1]
MDALGVSRIVEDSPMDDDVSRAGGSRAGAGEDASASMSRARSVFLNAVLSEPEVVALREAEMEVAAAGKGVTAAAEEAQREVEEDDAPGRIGEEKLFSNMMHDEWLEYLYEEILLLRCCHARGGQVVCSAFLLAAVAPTHGSTAAVLSCHTLSIPCTLAFSPVSPSSPCPFLRSALSPHGPCGCPRRQIERQNELLANQQQTAISRRGGSDGGPAEGEDAAGAGRGAGGKGVAGGVERGAGGRGEGAGRSGGAGSGGRGGGRGPGEGEKREKGSPGLSGAGDSEKGVRGPRCPVPISLPVFEPTAHPPSPMCSAAMTPIFHRASHLGPNHHDDSPFPSSSSSSSHTPHAAHHAPYSSSVLPPITPRTTRFTPRASAFSIASSTPTASVSPNLKAATALNSSAQVPTLLLHRPSQAASGLSHAVPAAPSPSTITDALSATHATHSPSSSPLHPAVVAAGGGAGLAGGRVAGRVGAVGMRRQRHRRVATIGSSVDLAELREEAARLDRSSGVEAAMVAAEAAVSGGRQMMRMWERMRRIMPSAGGVDVEDPTQSASPGSHPHLDDHAPDSGTPHHRHNQHHHAQQQAGQGEQQLPVVGPELLAALAKGKVKGEQRAKTWLAIACADPEDEIMSRRNYRNLLKQPSVSANEIQRDVNRTFPLHSMFQEEKGAGQKALFNVIKAYSVLDKEVGYCQGMGFIVATLLLLMGEEDAFCCLVFLLYKCGLRGVFLPDMQQLQVRMYQLSQLLIDAHPEVHAYFEELDVKPVMYAADWFLSLFARTMPHYIVFRVFDIICADKTTAIVFKLGMVLLQVCERQLQQCPEMEYAMHFLRVELPLQLKEVSEDYLEELVSKALRVHLPFDSLLRLEAEYELLAGEAAAAARHVRAAAAASEAAARSLECTRRDLEVRLHHALRARKQSHELAAIFKAAIAGLQQGGDESGTSEQSTQHSGKRQEQELEHTALNGHEPETASENVTANAASSAAADDAAASVAPGGGGTAETAALAVDQAGPNSETRGGGTRGRSVVRVSSRSSNEGALDLAVRYFEWKEWSEVAGNTATVAVLRQVEEARHACHETLTALAAAEVALAERAEQVAQEGEGERVMQEMVVVLEEGDEGGHGDEFY